MIMILGLYQLIVLFWFITKGSGLISLLNWN